MITWSIVLFTVAALLGLFVLYKVLRGHSIPRPAVLSHGFFALLAFILLLIFAVNNPDRGPWISFGFFAVIVAAGVYMFAQDMAKRKIPKWIALIHASLAVIAIFLLIAFAI